MNATLLIYRGEEIENEVVRPSRTRDCDASGYTTDCLPIAKRIEQLRGKLIRETELYLSDVASQTWPRANCNPTPRMSPAA